MAELHDLTAFEQRNALQTGDIGPVELTRHYLERIDRLNEPLGAFVTVTADAALDAARALEQSGPKPVTLWGLPFADKDLTQRKGVPCGFGSRLTAGFIPETSDEIATVLDDAGAISLGKTNTPEFGLPSYTESLVAPPAVTPYDMSLGAGGSSGGAAVAVAAGLLPFAPGSDGGGSVRIPAAACGLVGLKPSRGLIPAGSGIGSLGGLAVAGPLARTVADTALLADGMIGRSDGRVDHHFTLRAPELSGSLLQAALAAEGTFRLGVMTTTPWDDAYEITIAPEAQDALAQAVREFAALGHEIDQLALPPTPGYAPAFRTIWQAGAASIPAEREALHLLEPLTQWLVAVGRALSARQLAEALAALSAFEAQIIRLFAGFDAVLTPALAMTPRPVGWYDAEDAERNFAQQVQYTPFTSFVNVAGLPAITLPIAQTATGLPMGVQLIGRPGGEETLLALGAQLERVIDWQARHPVQW
ncbi:amidase [Homoserinimonas sp. OAct 916]|uniref:amidase n=1 Tax=Homoserinimonas sp. OAct 916 TaxID=2211450 RepID=UPI000DBE1736|nr:amidase [Homoserinimonas sp. OAct 916]